jgi:hypothetical protein
VKDQFLGLLGCPAAWRSGAAVQGKRSNKDRYGNHTAKEIQIQRRPPTHAIAERYA